MPASLSSLIAVPVRRLSDALAADGPESRHCLREWLTLVPDPRKRAGRWHPLEFVLALAVFAFTAAGHDSPTAIAEWAAGCSRDALLALGGRPDLLTGRTWPPSTRTFRRVLARIDADALNQALYGYLEAMPAAPAEALPGVTRREREQRRTAAAARDPAVPGLLPQAAADGKTARGAVRPDGSQGAAQVLRIRRDARPTRGPWASKEIAYGITTSPQASPAPATSPSMHVSTGPSKTGRRSATSPSGRTPAGPHREPAQRPRRHPQPRHRRIPQERHANIAHARRYYGRDDQRILALYGYI